MVYLCRLSTCNLNQWALDFDGNLERIIQSIKQAKEHGSRYRSGPELEICGYGCEDHFYEVDTEVHCWQSLVRLLDSDLSDDFMFDVGMPVTFSGMRLNCRVVCLNRQIILIRPKMCLAEDGNYREMRYFTAWQSMSVSRFTLPQVVTNANKQKECPIGVAMIQMTDSSISFETCEELFTPNSPHIALTLAGAEIISNSSGSHHTLRKLTRRIDLLRAASEKTKCAYMYANQQGCDGGRLYYDGCACIYLNGDMRAQSSQFSIQDIEVVTATLDLDEIRSKRTNMPSRMMQAAAQNTCALNQNGQQSNQVVPTIFVDYLVGSADVSDFVMSPVITPFIHTPEEEIALGPACWLWDYLRRSKQTGYFLPLSGGADSAATAAIVGSMCHLVVESVRKGDKQVIADVTRMLSNSNDRKADAPMPTDPQPASQSSDQSDALPAIFPRPFTAAALANCLFHTCYLGSENSGNETRNRAAQLAKEIGAYHLNVDIQSLVNACVTTVKFALNLSLRYKTGGGEVYENLALQNLQARSRMILSYAFASLLPYARGFKHGGSLLVLGSANVDEALRGYLTKYDCSSADLNPIGSVSKGDLRRFLIYAAEKYEYPTLLGIAHAAPTAELEPQTAEYVQTDEMDMGMTYEELGQYGRLREVQRCGPVSMFDRLREWTTTRGLSLREVGDKVKRFFFYYAINRHKCTVLTPAYHAEDYSPDDHRFDHRPFLYNAQWTRQFADIDAKIKQAEDKQKSSESKSS